MSKKETRKVLSLPISLVSSPSDDDVDEYNDDDDDGDDDNGDDYDDNDYDDDDD